MIGVFLWLQTLNEASVHAYRTAELQRTVGPGENMEKIKCK